jgi:multicomponent Na+:H+ antiporter subunit F
MMEYLILGAVIFLVLNLAAGLIRVAKGPTAADRMLATLLFGSTTVAVLLLMGAWLEQPALFDVALLFTLLATILSIAFVGVPSNRKEEPE